MSTPEEIFNEATEAATAAVAAEIARKPEDPNAFDCGFAWVNVKPARGPFVNWCKKKVQEAGGHFQAMQYGDRDSYEGGWKFWKPGGFNGQSIRIHEAGSKAFSEVLKKHNINCYWSSRLD